MITSLPGLGVIAAEASRSRRAPVREISGNHLRRPQRYNRRLQRVFYISELFSIRHFEASRQFYDRKRAEGKRHTQAVLALARRRVSR